MSDERWATLSDLYGTMRQTLQDDHFRASLLTRALRFQLVEYLGCSRDSVVLFDYDEVTYKYNPEGDAFRAVSMNNDYVWFVGMGVTLERAPNSYPKTTFQFPVWYHFNGDQTTVDTSFGRFVLPAGDKADFSEACEAIYEGFKKSLVNRANKQVTDKQFGFLNFDN